jgi:MFS family permease
MVSSPENENSNHRKPDAGGTSPLAQPGSPAAGSSPPRRSSTFASFKYRNYRLWFSGQLASLVGTWMQSTAQGFLIFQLTHSPVYLGYVGFASGIPIWLFTLYGGVISDRVSRRTMLVITQISMMILAFIQAGMTFAGVIQPWHIVLLAFLLGIANAFDAPARQAFSVELVDRPDMTNAIAWNSTLFNLATAIGPAVAGLTYALLGPAWCFTINGISFLAVIFALLMMRIPPQAIRTARTSATAELKESFLVVLRDPIIRNLMIMVAVATTFGIGYATLIPAWAVNVLGGNSATNGFLQSARGVGSLLGGIMLAYLAHLRIKGRLITLGSFVFPLLLLVFSAARSIPLSLLLAVGVGWGFMILLNLANALVQEQVRDELRGRVMGIYTLAFMGMMPIGALFAGALADWTSEPISVAVCALATILLAVILWFRFPRLRTLE